MGSVQYVGSIFIGSCMLFCIADVKRKQTATKKKSQYNIQSTKPEVPYYLYRDCQSTITKKKKIQEWKAQHNKKSNKYIIEVKCSCIIKQIKKLLEDL